MLSGIVAELAFYTKYHFAEEERRMKRYCYSGYDEYRAEHEFFVEKIKGYVIKLDAGNAGLSLTLLKFLGDWLISHIQKTDKRYTALFSANRVT